MVLPKDSDSSGGNPPKDGNAATGADSSSSAIVDAKTLDEIVKSCCEKEMKDTSKRFKLERRRLKVLRKLRKVEEAEKKTQCELDKKLMENDKLRKSKKCNGKRKRSSTSCSRTRKRRSNVCKRQCKSKKSQKRKPCSRKKAKKRKRPCNRKKPAKSYKCCKANSNIWESDEEEEENSALDSDTESETDSEDDDSGNEEEDEDSSNQALDSDNESVTDSEDDYSGNEEVGEGYNWTDSYDDSGNKHNTVEGDILFRSFTPESDEKTGSSTTRTETAVTVQTPLQTNQPDFKFKFPNGFLSGIEPEKIPMVDTDSINPQPAQESQWTPWSLTKFFSK